MVPRLRPRHFFFGLFVVAMNKVDVIVADTIFVLCLPKSGQIVGQTGSRLDGWSVGWTIGFIFQK